MSQFDANAWLDQGEQEFQTQNMASSIGSGFDANTWLDQGEQEFSQQPSFNANNWLDQGEHEFRQASLQPMQAQQLMLEPPPMQQGFAVPQAAPQAPQAPPTVPTQTGPKSFDLGATVSDFVNEIPLVKEVKNASFGQTIENLARGVPYGVSQLADVGNLALGAVPRAIEGGINSMFDPFAGTPKTPITDRILMGKGDDAQKYRKSESQRHEFMPETFKFGGALAQLLLPAGAGVEAANVGRAALFGAAENAALGGIQNAGEQLGETGTIDPGQLAFSSLVAAPLGALGGTLGYAGGKAFKQFAARSKPKEAPFTPHTTDMDAGLPPYQMTSGPSKEFYDSLRNAAPPVETVGVKATTQAPNTVPPASQIAGMPAAQPTNPMQFINDLTGRKKTQVQPSSSQLPKVPDSPLQAALRKPSSQSNTGLQENASAVEFINKLAPKGFFANTRRYIQGQTGNDVHVKFANEFERDLIAHGNRRNKELPHYVKSADAMAKELGISVDEFQQVARRYADDVRAAAREYSKANFNSPETLRMDAPTFNREAFVRPQLPQSPHSTPTPPAGPTAPKASVPTTTTKPSTAVPPVAPVTDAPSGVMRHQRTAFGRNKADSGQDISAFPPEVQQAVQHIAKSKMQLDYRQAVLDDYSQQLWKLLQKKGLVSDDDAAFLGPNKAIIKKSADRRLSVHEEGELQKLREKLATGTTAPSDKQHISSLLGGRFGGTGKYDLKKPTLKVPDDLDKAFDTLARLKKVVSETEKQYKTIKSHYQSTLEQAQSVLRADNPQASFRTRAQVTAPMKEVVDAQVSLDYNPMRLTLSKEAEETYKKARELAFELQQKDRNYQPKFSYDVSIRNVSNVLAKDILKKSQLPIGNKIMPQFAAALAGADLTRDHENEPDWWTGVRATAEIAALLYGSRQAAKWVFKPENVVLGKYFKDSVGRIEDLDNLLNTNVQFDIFAHMGAIHEANFGLKIDADLRAHAMSLLRKGDEQGALNLGLDQAQLEAISKTLDLEQRLAGIIREQKEAGQEAIKQLKAAGQKTGHLEDSIKALNGMESALTGYNLREDTAAVEDYSKVMRRIFNYHFNSNLAFELLNLGDMFNLGAAKVGPLNLGKALISLGPKGNKELKQLFKHSNLTGGFTADSTALGAQTGQLQRKSKLSLFGKELPGLPKADQINADRVGLAAMYQYRQGKAVLNGYTGSDEQFALDLLTGKLQPEMALDAWAHVAESASRTLGVDPVKVNTDVFSSSALGPYIGVFVKQPARTINLLANYLKNNQKAPFFTMLGAYALASGQSVLPGEVQEVWKNLDPKAYFMVAATLNKANIPSAITGKTLETKSRYSIFYPLQAASDPVRSSGGQSLVAAVDIIQKFMSEGDFNYSKAQTALANIASVAFPTIKGVPVKPALAATRAAYESYGIPGIEEAQGKKVHYFGQLERYGQSENVPLEELGINPVQNVVGSFLPGEWTSVRNRQLAREEQHKLNNNFIGNQNQDARYFQVDDGRTPLQPQIGGPHISRQTDPASALLNWLFPKKAANY